MPRERLRGRVRWTMCVTSWVTRSSIQSVQSPIPDSGSGGDVQSTMKGRSRNGKAIPFAVAAGSSTRRSIERPERNPTASETRSWIDSMEAAARRAHGAKGAGKCTRKCAVSIVRQAAEGDWAAANREPIRSEEHTSELQSHSDLVCRLLLEKKKKKK